MGGKLVFKTKTFDRWAKKAVGDVLLCAAAREIEAKVLADGLQALDTEKLAQMARTGC